MLRSEFIWIVNKLISPPLSFTTLPRPSPFSFTSMCNSSTYILVSCPNDIEANGWYFLMLHKQHFGQNHSNMTYSICYLSPPLPSTTPSQTTPTSIYKKTYQHTFLIHAQKALKQMDDISSFCPANVLDGIQLDCQKFWGHGMQRKRVWLGESERNQRTRKKSI